MLLCERDPQSTTEKKYYPSNLPKGTTLLRLVALAHTRWSIEQSYQQIKEELGLDQVEGRTYSGFHRHAVLTALSFAFLQSERRRHRGALVPTLPHLRRLVKRIVGLLTIVTDKQLRADFEFLARRYPADTS